MPLPLRPARPEDAARGGPLLYSTGAPAFRHIFGLGDEARAVALLTDGFAQPRGAYSHRFATCAEAGASIAGLALGFPERQRAALDRQLLGLLLRRFTLLEFPRMLARGLRAQRLVRGVPPDGYYLAHLAVDPAHRRAGVGAQLLDAVLERAEAAGAPACLLHVSINNAPAQALYRQRGFEIIAEFRDVALERQAGIPGQYLMRARTPRRPAP